MLALIIIIIIITLLVNIIPKGFKQESHAVARKPRDAAAVVFGLKFTDNIHCKFKSIASASKARLQRSKRTEAKQILTQNGHLRSRVLESVERR